MRRYITSNDCRRFIAIGAFLLVAQFVANAQERNKLPESDTIPELDTTQYFIGTDRSDGVFFQSSQLAVNNGDSNLLNMLPYVSIQQQGKGRLSGVLTSEPSGEPGTDQPIFIQGLNGPLLTKKDLFDQQATVFLNGIPLTRDHPFAYEIQKTDYTRIGTNTNNLAIFHIDNIQSIKVIKDPAALAALGPLAANGAIWITTKNASAGQNKGSVNLYSGFVSVPAISPTNSAYERAFRQPYYNKYASIEDLINVPAFLKDSTNADYYGPANWYESYYKPTYTYGADASLEGGSERANFRLFLSSVRDANSADRTALQRHNASFFINVAPLTWLNFSSMINYNRLDRTRNRSITERLAEQRYLPDLANPLTPNKVLYDEYLHEFDKAIDDNVNNSFQSYFTLTARYKTLQLHSSLMVDYSDITRDAFWPQTLLEKNNFVSHYLGINQRVLISNAVSNEFEFTGPHRLKLTARQSYVTDMYRYKYAIGYNGPNDFIKINLYHNNSDEAAYISYYYPNRISTALLTYSGEAAYSYNDVLFVNAVVRRDGSSTKDLDNRWITGYSGSVEYDLGKQLQLERAGMRLFAGYGRIGKVISDDRFSNGPIYSSYVGWSNEPTLGTYLGLPALARPYNFGWVGNDLPWAYYEKMNIGIQHSLLGNRVNYAIEFYNRNDKNGALLVPTPAEWGYEGQYLSGLEVNNRGLDFSLNALIIKNQRGINWSLNGNISFNANKLVALPNGRSEIIVANSKLKVGERVDALWLYKNEGIYNSDADVPQNPATGKPLTYNGVTFGAGDARWVDTNGDFDVNNADRVLMGNYMPKQFGGFGTRLDYKGLSLDLQFYFAAGQKYLNQYAASRLDFVNSDFTKALSSVKEITFWQKGEDLSGYPQYNPWSSLVPFQLNQDLFMQDASYIKLRSATLAYSIPTNDRLIKKAQVYLIGNNLLTFTKFKGDDPELINYQGIYDGKALPLVRTVTLGVRIDL
ncbi:SusC/RagA family TonB-linked outer membrane protein [Niabella terrae]